MRIIIADDVFYARKAIEKMVLAWDPDSDILELCDNGARVIALISTRAVDVLILDIRMPGVDGLQIAEIVRSDYPQVRIILVSGYAEFEYAQAAVRNGVFRYLLKPLKKEELFAVLDELRRTAVRRDGQSVSETQYVASSYRMMRYLAGIENAAPFCPLPESVLHKGFVLVAIHCEGIQTLRLLTLVEQTLHAEAFLYNDLLHVENRVLLLCNYSGVSLQQFRKEAERQLENLAAAVSAVEGLALFAGFSEPLAELSEMPSRYQEARRALCMRLIEPKRRVFRFEITASTRVLSRDDLRILRSKLQTRREDDARQLVMRRLRALPPLRLTQLEQLYGDLLTLCMTLSMEKGTAEEDRQLPRGLWEFNSKAELKRYLTGLLDHKQSEKTGEGGIISEIQAFLRENYYCDLSLNELAATKYYMNPNYLSRLFKAVTGIGFSKYLLTLRMEKAKELLADTSLSIGEIASMVGYTSTSYFIANFKKYFGETPGTLSETLRES